MPINFPVKTCPHCHHDRFKNNISMHGVTTVTYNNDGEPIDTKIKTMNYTNSRDTWFCARCDAIVFRLNDCTVTQK